MSDTDFTLGDARAAHPKWFEGRGDAFLRQFPLWGAVIVVTVSNSAGAEDATYEVHRLDDAGHADTLGPPAGFSSLDYAVGVAELVARAEDFNRLHRLINNEDSLCNQCLDEDNETWAAYEYTVDQPPDAPNWDLWPNEQLCLEHVPEYLGVADPVSFDFDGSRRDPHKRKSLVLTTTFDRIVIESGTDTAARLLKKLATRLPTGPDA